MRPTSVPSVLGFEVCPTTSGFGGSGNQTQGFLHARQITSITIPHIPSQRHFVVQAVILHNPSSLVAASCMCIPCALQQ